MSTSAAVIPLRAATEQSTSKANWEDVFTRIQKALAGGVLKQEPANLFQPMEGQPRVYFDQGAMSRLTDSIRKVGQIQFGLSRNVQNASSGAKYEILDGERRWRAVSTIGATHIYRALVIDLDDDAARYATSTIANFNRESNTPMEVSDAIYKIHTELGAPMSEVAKLVGMSEHYAYQMLGLHNLHPDVRAMLDPTLAKDRILPTTAAIQISKLHPDLQVRMADQVLNKSVSLKTLRSEVVRTGEVHGTPVRTREVRPDKQWESIVNTARASVEGLRTVRERAKDPHVARMIADREPTELGALIHQVEEHKKVADETLRLLKDLASKKRP